VLCSLALTIPEVERISRLHVGPIFGSDARANLDNGGTSGTIIKGSRPGAKPRRLERRPNLDWTGAIFASKFSSVNCGS
jgi:hypothetical protein